MSITEAKSVDSSRAPRDWLFLIVANALVFTSALCIMILELVASRLVAQHLGSSLYTWTSVIGVILAGMSVGNYTGGWLADRLVPRRILGWLFVLSSAMSLSVLGLNHLMAGVPRPDMFSWPTWILTCVTLIFFAPACILGTISPVVAKMALDRSQRTGLTVGNIYAWGAAGSIVGTFLTGFVLLNAMGNRAIVGLVAGGLAALGLLLIVKFWKVKS